MTTVTVEGVSYIGPDELGKTLRDIQNSDTEILGLRRDVEGLAGKYNLDGLLGQLGEARKKRESAVKNLEDLEHDQHKIEGELDLISSKISKEEEKLFSGTVMNPKELSAIQAEILSLRKKSDEMETEDLEMMEAVDRGKLEVEKTGRQGETISADERKAHDECDRELAEKEHQIRELEGKRDELKCGVEEETLALYEELLESKGGLAVAVIEQGRNCGGCHVEFSRTQIDRFQHGEGIFRCEYCRRILVK